MGNQLNRDDLFKFAYRGQPHCAIRPISHNPPSLFYSLCHGWMVDGAPTPPVLHRIRLLSANLQSNRRRVVGEVSGWISK